MKNQPQIDCTRTSGFTLIELMIVVAIVGILAAVAYPSYIQYVIRANRADAEQFAMSVAQLEEQYFLNNRTYGDAAAIGVSAIPDGVIKHYNPGAFITVTAAAAGVQPAYVIRLTPSSTLMTGDHDIMANNLGQHWRDLDNNGAYNAGEDW